MTSVSRMARMHKAVTIYPVAVNCPNTLSIDRPVCLQKRMNTGIWHSTVAKESNRIMTMSITLSVTTLPTERVKLTPS